MSDRTTYKIAGFLLMLVPLAVTIVAQDMASSMTIVALIGLAIIMVSCARA